MSHRLVIPDRIEVEQDLSVTHPWWSFSTRFNVAAPHSVPVARMHENESEGVMMRWGLVPADTRPEEAGEGTPDIGRDSIELADDMRQVWTSGQRCILPLAGFYVWEQVPAGYRQPFYVRVVSRPVFGVAALWDRFVTEDDDVIEGCAIITVAANSLLSQTARDRQMPAILRRDAYSRWLTGSPSQALELLGPYPAERMLMHAVGPRVNFLQFDDPSLIRPIARQG